MSRNGPPSRSTVRIAPSSRKRCTHGSARRLRPRSDVTSLALTVTPLSLPLHHTFTISRRSDPVAETALVRLRWNGIEALGETSPSDRYGESIASVSAELHGRLLGDDPY